MGVTKIWSLVHLGRLVVIRLGKKYSVYPFRSLTRQWKKNYAYACPFAFNIFLHLPAASVFGFLKVFLSFSITFVYSFRIGSLSATWSPYGVRIDLTILPRSGFWAAFFHRRMLYIKRFTKKVWMFKWSLRNGCLAAGHNNTKWNTYTNDNEMK